MMRFFLCAHVAEKLLGELSHVLLKFARVLLFLLEARHVVSHQLARKQQDNHVTSVDVYLRIPGKTYGIVRLKGKKSAETDTTKTSGEIKASLRRETKEGCESPRRRDRRLCTAALSPTRTRRRPCRPTPWTRNRSRAGRVGPGRLPAKKKTFKYFN